MNGIDVLAFWTPSPFELVVIMVIALLLFGKRLPEVARSLGKGVVEFKKGLKGVEEDVDHTSNSAAYTPPPARKVEDKAPATYEDGGAPKA
jgi:sec-independent protein translocase protein TatA